MTMILGCAAVEKVVSLHEIVLNNIKGALERKGLSIDGIEEGSYEGVSDKTAIKGAYKRTSEETLDEATFNRLFLEAFQDCPKTFQNSLASKHAVLVRHEVGMLTLFVEIILKKQEDGKIYASLLREYEELKWSKRPIMWEEL